MEWLLRIHIDDDIHWGKKKRLLELGTAGQTQSLASEFRRTLITEYSQFRRQNQILL